MALGELLPAKMMTLWCECCCKRADTYQLDVNMAHDRYEIRVWCHGQYDLKFIPRDTLVGGVIKVFTVEDGFVPPVLTNRCRRQLSL